jgi:ATP-dependent HslUV protease subunit HslV
MIKCVKNKGLFMTTIVAVKKNGIVAIAADTLTTFGNTRLHATQDASHDKILQIGDSYIGVCGSAAHHPKSGSYPAPIANN